MTVEQQSTKFEDVDSSSGGVTRHCSTRVLLDVVHSTFTCCRSFFCFVATTRPHKKTKRKAARDHSHSNCGTVFSLLLGGISRIAKGLVSDVAPFFFDFLLFCLIFFFPQKVALLSSQGSDGSPVMGLSRCGVENCVGRSRSRDWRRHARLVSEKNNASWCVTGVYCAVPRMKSLDVVRDWLLDLFTGASSPVTQRVSESENRFCYDFNGCTSRI